MGRITKAIKLKLQELRIDDIFKEGILKYKEPVINEEIPNDKSENNSEEDMKVNNDLGVSKDIEINKDYVDNKDLKYDKEIQGDNESENRKHELEENNDLKGY